MFGYLGSLVSHIYKRQSSRKKLEEIEIEVTVQNTECLLFFIYVGDKQ